MNAARGAFSKRIHAWPNGHGGTSRRPTTMPREIALP